MTKKTSILPIFAIALVLVLVVQPVYATIDDVFIAAILDGRLSGNPSTDTVYVGGCLSAIFAFLYKIVPMVPWFGVFQLAAVTAFFCVLSGCLFPKKTQRTKGSVLFWAVATCFVFLGYGIKNILLPTYTITAGFLAGAGCILLCFLEKENMVPSYIGAGLFFWLSYELRSKIFFMALPFIGLILFYKIITCKKEERGKIRAGGIFLLVLAMLIGGMVLVDRHKAQSDDAHKSFAAFNEIRTEVLDYYAIYEDPEVVAFYEAAGVPAAEIKMDRSQLWLLKEDYSTDSLEIYASYGRALHNYPVWKGMKWAVPRLLEEATQGLNLYYNIFVGLLFLLFIVQGIRHRKNTCFFRGLLVFLLLLAGRFLILLYLMGTGRYPERVTTPLYLWECIIALGLVRSVCDPQQESLKKEIPVWAVLGTGSVFAIMCAALMALPAYRMQVAVNEPFYELEEEMAADTDKLYLLDTYAFCHATEKVLRIPAKKDGPENRILLGGWLPNHPILLEKFRAFGSESAAELLRNGKAVFVTRQDTQFGPTVDTVQEYLQAHMVEDRLIEMQDVPEEVLNRLHAEAIKFMMYKVDE